MYFFQDTIFLRFTVSSSYRKFIEWVSGKKIRADIIPVAGAFAIKHETLVHGLHFFLFDDILRILQLIEREFLQLFTNLDNKGKLNKYIGNNIDKGAYII